MFLVIENDEGEIRAYRSRPSLYREKSDYHYPTSLQSARFIAQSPRRGRTQRLSPTGA